MEFTIKTSKHHELIDITQKAKDFVRDTKDGALLVFTTHTTAAIVINEHGKRLLQDIEEFLEQLVPTNKNYKHDNIEKRNCQENEPKNTHSHLKALLLGPSKIVPIKDNQLQLGTWQKIFLEEEDGPRTRTVIFKILH